MSQRLSRTLGLERTDGLVSLDGRRAYLLIPMACWSRVIRRSRSCIDIEVWTNS